MPPKKIVDAVNDSKGNIKAVRFEGNKSFTPLETAIRMTDRGEVAKAHVVRPKDAATHLRTNPDSSTNNNLDKLAED